MTKQTKKPSAKRVCKVVEKMCYVFWDGAYTLTAAEAIIDRIYKYSHLLSDCKNPHMDWREEFYEIEKEIK